MKSRELEQAQLIIYLYRAAIVLIHNTDEFNLADQRSIQYELLKLNPRIPFMRVVFSTLPTSMTLDEDRRLFM